VISRLIITPAAELDLAESRDWYESTRLGLSKDFQLAVDAIFNQIARHPEAFTPMERGVRRALLSRFPHAVLYRSQVDAIQVIAVLHTSRNPRIWQARAH
jgi:plasmid stabilization system protein ParE